VTLAVTVMRYNFPEAVPQKGVISLEKVFCGGVGLPIWRSGLIDLQSWLRSLWFVSRGCHLFGGYKKGWFLKKELSGYISLLFLGSGGPAYFYLLPCIFDILISSIWSPE
jgi:hypothetical protein